MRNLMITTLVLTIVFAVPTQAIRNLDLTGNDLGADMVYTFDNLPTNGQTPATVLSAQDLVNRFDLISSRDGNLPTSADLRAKVSIDPLDLLKVILNEKPFNDNNIPGYQRAQKDRSFLVWNPSVLATARPRVKACDGTGMTIQAFVRPHFPFQGSRSNGRPNTFGNMIVGFSNSNPNAIPTASDTEDLIAIPDFAIYQVEGDNSPTKAMVRVRTAGGQATALSNANFFSLTKNENVGVWSEIVASYEVVGNGGRLGIYLNRVPGELKNIPRGSFSGASTLVMGNELVRLNANATPDPTTLELDPDQLVKDQRNWSGEIAHVAIYCRGFSSAEILGSFDQYRVKAATYFPVRTPITKARQHAQKMASRLAGVTFPIDHPDVVKMEGLIAAGDMISAAKVITGDKASNQEGNSSFLNIVVKQMALQMSNREETIRVPLNDFAATVMGVTRDETSAKELLTGNFYYTADSNKAAVPNDLVKDILETNRHFEALDDPSASWNIGKVLTRREGQKMVTSSSGTLIEHPDPAGVITSRAFMAAHAIAGTNRRLVEYSFREFACVPMNEMADTSSSKARIGRDVDRSPGQDVTKFETNCKGCHTVMDGFRGAFAKFHFKGTDINSGIVLNADVHGDTNNNNDNYAFTTNLASGNARSPASLTDLNNSPRMNIVYKMNHNFDVFSAGTYMTKDNSFVNNAVGPKNKTFFGWRGENANGGFGAGQFGRMLADSKRFSQCMSKRVFEAVCLPGAEYDLDKHKAMIFNYADRFESVHQYNLKKLFQDMAADVACVKP